MPTFELAQLQARPGERVKGHLGHVVLADGTRVGVPVVILNGVEDGPTLVVTASVHGTEIVGTGALLDVLRRTDPQQMRGRLIAVTVANPFAFQVGSYFTPFISPTDGLNLSTVNIWPANPAGRLTERIAAIVGQAVEVATHFLDVHANPDLAIPFTLVNWATCRDEATRRETARMAEAWGSTIVDENDSNSTIMSSRAPAHGIPAMCPELTADLVLRDDNVRVGVIGITNVMKTIGMIEGALEAQQDPKLEGDFVFHGRLTTSTGGLMRVRSTPGTLIAKSDVVVEIIDVWGDVVEELRMPVDGYCWSFTGGIGSTHAVPEGTSIAYIFRHRDQSTTSATRSLVERS